MTLPPSAWLSLIIAAVTLIGVALGRLPWVRLNRAAIALAGAALLIAAGVLDLEEAWHHIDGDTLVLLLSLMILNAFLALGGFFRLLTRVAVRRARSPLGLLTALVFSSGILSALFLNDTVALMLTPLVISICRALQRPVVPYLLALACSANVGSTATITGNPQNLIIGVQSGLSYLEFAAALAPVALCGLAVVVAVIALSYRQEFLTGIRLSPLVLPPLQTHRPILVKASVVSSLMLVAFLLGVPVASAALVAAAALLVTRRVKSDKVFQKVNWELLVLFAGLFVVTGSLEESGFSAWLFTWLAPLLVSGALWLAALTAALSNLLSNVPAVLLLAPLIRGLDDPTQAWLTVAMASTLAGNLTLIGSIVNLIVAESARREGVTLSFVAYLKVGVPITVLTLALGVWWLR